MLGHGNDFGGLLNLHHINTFNMNEREDQDIADLPPEYQKALAPYESDINTAYVDEQSMKTIVYVDTKEIANEIKRKLGNNVEKIETTSDDIKIILK